MPVYHSDELVLSDSPGENMNAADQNSLIPWKIILADDEKEIHTLTKMVLRDYTFKDRSIEILSAYSGEQACALIRENIDTALILLDVVMEEDDSGLKVVKYIREELGNEYVRIILRTGQPGQAPENKIIINYDINDYKEKTELSAQKLITAVVASLRAYENIIRIGQLNLELEKKVMDRTRKLHEINTQLLDTNNKMKKDLLMAKKIQQALIPTIFPDHPAIRFAGTYEAMEELGGDYYDVFRIAENKFGIVIADVSGHGVPSALITAIAKMAFSNYSEEHFSTSQITGKVNKSIYACLGDLGYFLTTFYCIIDLENKILEYTNAGHNGAYLQRADGSLEQLNTKPSFIGFFDNLEYETKETKIYDKDRLILYTDGLSEARNNKGELFGKNRFENLLVANRPVELDDLLQNILKEIDRFCGDYSANDDRTLLAADIRFNK